MKHTGKTTKKGNPSKQRITFGFGIPIPRPLPYKELMNNIAQIDIGELISVRHIVCYLTPRTESCWCVQKTGNNASHPKQILS